MINKKLLFLTTLIFINISSVFPVFAATTSSTQPVQVTVSPTIAIATTWNSGANNSTIKLGSLDADGLQKTYIGGKSGEQLFTFSNMAVDVYTKTSGPLSSGTDTIALTNFRYRGGSVGTARAFTTSYYKMYNNWAKAPVANSRAASINLYLTVPIGTTPGNYSTTIYFAAVKHNAATPNVP